MAKRILYIGVAAESSTLYPSKGGELLSVAFHAPYEKRFEINLQSSLDVYGKWKEFPAEWKELRANQTQTIEAAKLASEWLIGLKSTLIPIGDWAEYWWVYDWLMECTGTCLLGSKPLDLRSFACGVAKKISRRASLVRGMEELKTAILPKDVARVRFEVVKGVLKRDQEIVEKEAKLPEMRENLRMRRAQAPPINWAYLDTPILGG